MGRGATIGLTIPAELTPLHSVAQQISL